MFQKIAKVSVTNLVTIFWETSQNHRSCGSHVSPLIGPHEMIPVCHGKRVLGDSFLFVND